MGKLKLIYVSILHDMIRPIKFERKDIACGGGEGGGLDWQEKSKLSDF